MAYQKLNWLNKGETGAIPINKDNLNHMDNGIADLYDAIFPIGQIIIKGDDADYSNWLGFTWERTAVGKVLVGYDNKDTDFNTIGKTGGEKEHTLTRNELPNESLDIYDASYLPRKVPVASYGKAVGVDYPGVILTSNEKADEGLYIVTEALGDGQAHNNMQPYQVVAYWKRVS